MKIIVNATTLVVGGGVQVGVSFIEKALCFVGEHEFLFLTSEQVFQSLSLAHRNDKRMVVLERSPAHPIYGFKVRRRIRSIESDFNPDIVYSIGFPSYICFKSQEVGRYTNPWEINSEPLPWHLYNTNFKKIKAKLGIVYRQLWAKRADYIETQTLSAKDGIAKRIGFDLEKIFVIPNSINRVFTDSSSNNVNQPVDHVAFSLAAAYPHKNLAIIPRVIRELLDSHSIQVKFLLTLEDESELWREISELAELLNVGHLVQNLGKLSLPQCLDVYESSSFVFLPTLLEIFSATYLEAMDVGIPIVTSDLEFAHDNCGSAALYFSPYSYKDAANTINRLLTDTALYNKLVLLGKEKLSTYQSADDKFITLLDQFKSIREI